MSGKLHLVQQLATAVNQLAGARASFENIRTSDGTPLALDATIKAVLTKIQDIVAEANNDDD